MLVFDYCCQGISHADISESVSSSPASDTVSVVRYFGAYSLQPKSINEQCKKNPDIPMPNLPELWHGRHRALSIAYR